MLMPSALRLPTKILASLLAGWLAVGVPAVAIAAGSGKGSSGKPAAPATPAPPPPPPAEPPPPAYEKSLLRLSEILGALHFLGGICKVDEPVSWRDRMQALLDGEKPQAAERARLISSFNYGFETYNAVYRTCTPSAERAMELYLAEGQKLSTELRSRYAQ
ncbi:TIGR02301 family protein [Faunimonas pinastri]|uniref:TIGR02301 family protein n=1 Tax=Faunimonas pinastri TaxID=1855383 RepID=A0A1H8ZXB5_9HYPH|nr:TIGR02301 family protein [Faunimonas pinastri]SEP68408.1 TIGR02301 family protein [Faunimonas pinastri]